MANTFDAFDGPPLTWGQVAQGAIVNAPSSIGQLASDTVQPFLHPIDTAQNLYRVGSGAVNKLAPGYGSQENEPYAEAVGRFFKERYGSMEGFKKTLATDPAGVAADAATVLSGGGGLAARAPGAAGRVGTMTAQVGRAIDPFVNAARVAAPVAAPIGRYATDILGGLGTHTGGQSIRTAASAGYQGGNAADAFRDSIRGNIPMESVIDDAKVAVGNMRAERSADYTKGMAGVAADTTPLAFHDIDQALVQSNKVKQFRGEDLSPKTAEVRKEISDTIDQWKKFAATDPAFRTAEGMDALKQKIGDIKDAQPFNSPQRAIANQIYSAVRDTIVKQAPDYAKVMKGYEKGSNAIEEMQRTLSLNPKATVDTQLRKLQSVMRNDVTTNYGKRADLANALESYGAPNLMEKLAGQTMNPIVPRGLGRAMAGPQLALAYLADPTYLALAPLMSPRVVGEAAYYSGKMASQGVPRGALLTALQAGRQNPGQQNNKTRDALGAALMNAPSWLHQMSAQTRRDREAYQRGGVPELMGDTQNTASLFGGFAGTTVAKQLPRPQSMPTVKINGEIYQGYTHEGALERAAQARGMKETVNDLVDGLGGWNKVRDNHFGYLNAADEFIPIRDAMDPTKYR